MHIGKWPLARHVGGAGEQEKAHLLFDCAEVKRNIIDYIWKSAKLEGLAVTYPDTEAIYNGMSVQGVKVSDIVAVNNLKHAWQFVLDTLDCPTDYPFVCKINQYVGGDNLIIRAGYLRNMPVSIGGTTMEAGHAD